MNELISSKEIEQATGKSQTAVYRMLRYCPFEMEASGRGRPKKVYPYASLPKDVRAAVDELRLRQSLEAGDGGPVDPSINSNMILQKAQDHLDHVSKNGNGNGAIANGNGSRMPAAPANGNGNGTVPIPQRARGVGLAKYQLVLKWRQVVGAQPWGKRGEATDAFLTAYRSGHLLPGVYETLGDISAKTIARLDRQLRASAEGNGHEDYTAIADGRGGWKKYGTTKWKCRQLDRPAQDALLKCYLQPNKPSVQSAILGAKLLLSQSGLGDSHSLQLSDSTYRRWLDDFERRNYHVVVLARRGDKAMQDLVGPYITRDQASLTVGQVLVADGHDLNFMVLHPETGKPCRMKLIMFFDWASRMPVGWQIMPTESTVAISAALRNAIYNLGKYPQCVYLDNGRAFKAKVFTETDPNFDEFLGLYGRLGIATIFAEPYRARSKVVERFFLTVGDQFERLMPSYCGADIHDKPAWRMRNEKFHKAWHEARTAGWVPNIRETAYLLRIYFDWYANQPHKGLGGRTPGDVFAAGRGPGVDVEELNFEFLWPAACTPRRCRITLYGIDYESDCLYGLRPDRKSVVVRYDTADLSRVWCWEKESGQYLGEAHPVAALPPVAKLIGDECGVDQVKAAIARQRGLAKRAKRDLIELGVAAETAAAMTKAPWAEKAAVLPGGQSSDRRELPAIEAETGPDCDGMSDEECRRLELVVSRAEAEIEAQKAAAEAPDRPEYFNSLVERYEWCFRAKHQHGYELSDADAGFMVFFEAEPEFENYRQRFEDLAELFALYGEMEQGS